MLATKGLSIAEVWINLAKEKAANAAATAYMNAIPGAQALALVPLNAMATARAVANTALIAAQTFTQFNTGKYDVIGATDGRTYRAGYAPAAQTGIYSSPTLIGGLGLVGERAPELVVDGPTLRNIQMNYPEIINAIQAARVPQFAEGNYPATVTAAQPPATQQQQTPSPEMIAMLQSLAEISQKLDNPTRAVVVYSDLEDAQIEMDEIRNSVSK
jgi:hypothetical protein